MVCFQSLKPQSARASNCCDGYIFVDFAQELALVILGHDALTAEGLEEDINDYKGIPPIPFSFELLLWACSTNLFRKILENGIRESMSWKGEEGVVKDLVDEVFPGGTLVVNRLMWE